jgi:hypothetical protein
MQTVLHGVKVFLDWTAAMAWPAAILTIALIYRKPIYALLYYIGGVAERATKEPFKATVGNFSMEFKEAISAKNPQTVQDAVNAATEIAENLVPYGIPIPGRPDLVQSPFSGKYVKFHHSLREQKLETHILEASSVYRNRVCELIASLKRKPEPKSPLQVSINAVSCSSARTTKRFPSPRLALSR